MWYHYDRLGNVMDLTDENGNLSASYDQSAFGNVLSGNQTGYHLTTKEYNSFISLYYFLFRWAEPELGCFVTKNQLPSYHEHSYGYVEKNPTNFIDPLGLYSYNYPPGTHPGNCHWIGGSVDLLICDYIPDPHCMARALQVLNLLIHQKDQVNILMFRNVRIISIRHIVHFIEGILPVIVF